MRNSFKKRKLSKSAPPPAPFSFNRNRLDPSVPLSRRGGGSGRRGGLGSDSNQILELSSGKSFLGWGWGVRLGFLARDLGSHVCSTVPVRGGLLVGSTCPYLGARRLLPGVNTDVCSRALCVHGCVRSGIWLSGNCARVSASRRGSGPRPTSRGRRCLAAQRRGQAAPCLPPARARAPLRVCGAACPRAASAGPLLPLPLGPLSASDKAFPSIVILPGRPGCQGPPPPGPLPSSRVSQSLRSLGDWGDVRPAPSPRRAMSPPL